MGVLNDNARTCLEDCLLATNHLGEANALRSPRSFRKKDAAVYEKQLFTMRVSSAQRAFARAKESFATVDGPSHSRVVRVCTQACESYEEVMRMLEARERPNDVRAAAAKLLRHCQRALSG